jgi:hypothetical protein
MIEDYKSEAIDGTYTIYAYGDKEGRTTKALPLKEVRGYV